MGELANTDLTESLLPGPFSSWSSIVGFAHQFNGYEQAGSFEKCGEVANRARDHYERLKLLPRTLTELRTCLFFEARRWRHYGYDPREEDMTYIHAVVEEIRKRVRYRVFE